MLKGKTIILGVTGGIAAYKAAGLASALTKLHASVQVIMTENAQHFITPNTFEAITKQKCLTDTFDRDHPFEVEHIALAKRADLVIIAPATANTMAKLAYGFADDMLTTTVLACTCPKLIAPAMNTAMYENPVTRENEQRLRRFGWTVIEPEAGVLACGDVGRGRLPDQELILEYILRELALPKDLAGKRVLVTAGPTQESIDPVRYITNHSTGKMGVSGPTGLERPSFVNFVPIVSAADLFREVTARAPEQDIIITPAAVADYRPASVSDEKIHKKEGDLSIALERTEDTLQYLGDHKPEGQILCGFAMETSDLEERARGKLAKKNLDMIVANNLKVKGAGFGTDTNVVTLITRDGEEKLAIMSKKDVAMRILDRLAGMDTAYSSHAIQNRMRADSVLLSFPSPLTQRLRVIFGLLRITPSPLLISLTAFRGLIACEL